MTVPAAARTPFDRAGRLADPGAAARRADPGARRRDGHAASSATGSTEADFRGERFARPPAGPARRQRRAVPDPARRRRGHPRRLPRRRRRHHRDEHLQRARPSRRPTTGCEASSTRSTSRPPASRATAADAAEAREPGRPRFVAGSLGPTNTHGLDLARRRTTPAAAPSPSTTCAAAYARGGARPARRRRGPAPDRDDLRHAERQGRDLRHRGGSSTRRAAGAADALGHDHRRERPHALGPDRRGVLERRSPTPGRCASGSTARSARRELRPPRRGARRGSRPIFVSAYPNAGPARTTSAATTRRPRRRPRLLGEFAARGLVNIVGGCCGTTPGARPRHRRRRSPACRRGCPPAPAAASAWRVSSRSMPPPGGSFVNIGERTNVSGSRRFARLVATATSTSALGSPAQQVEGGAHVLDVNMDEALLDSRGGDDDASSTSWPPSRTSPGCRS